MMSKQNVPVDRLLLIPLDYIKLVFYQPAKTSCTNRSLAQSESSSLLLLYYYAGCCNTRTSVSDSHVSLVLVMIITKPIHLPKPSGRE